MSDHARLRILVAGHDWGGLNLLVPLLRQWQGHGRLATHFVGTPVVRRDLEHLVRGVELAPGLESFDEWLSSHPAQLESFLAGLLQRGRYDLVLCSTSAHAPLERRLFRAARAAGIPSVAFCDMWWAYAERFREAGEWCLPDRLWVVDDRMRDAAAAVEWPAPLPIEVIGSPLFGHLAARRVDQSSARGGSIRFVSEPVSTKYPEARIDEFALAEMLVDVARSIGSAAPLVIRPHPADSQETWRRWIFARRDRGVTLETLPVDEAIADTQVAVGISSILLTEMRMCGVPAASLQPPTADANYFCLPFDSMGIVRIETRQALAQWLLAPGDGRVPEAATLHVDAMSKATNRVVELAALHAGPSGPCVA